ncbi:anti-sigma factor family protein [Fimbriiglobus ruber]|uniref:Putative zinc-finger domain-containing protein n=1 Tax=Fimbriiglobus ruber TaxID=1908690 RepID=A0A225DXZ3_9BACT|nr:zf-HC2 domain-containing protein [Fimbriiglobus ruber]OWK44444.1 hypothetical protein FRUB_02376 [Fimbriiglobus ruber]
MICDDVRGHLPLYLTADLPPPTAAAVRDHLAGCGACRADHADLLAVRSLLDAAPLPVVPPVDLGAVYQAALARHAQSARLGRRGACAAAALAAGIAFLALVPRVEITLGASEFAVRWGLPAPVVPQPVAPIPPPPAPPAGPGPSEYANLVRQQAETEARLHDLKDLLLTLAADVDERDQKQKDRIAVVLQQLRGLDASTREQFRETEKTNSALYTAVFDKPRTEGARP